MPSQLTADDIVPLVAALTPQERTRLLRLIARLGYTSWWHLPPLFNPENYAGNRKNVFGRIVSANLLCVPEELPETIEDLRRIRDPAVTLRRCN